MTKLHTTAFKKSITNGVTAFTALDAIRDNVYAKASSEGLYVPAGHSVVAAFAGSNNIQLARINSPTMLKVGYPYIRPLGGVYGIDDPNFQVLVERPLLFKDTEVVGIDAIHNAGVPQTVWALLWTQSEFEPTPPGDAFWLRMLDEGSTTVDSQWTALDNIQFDQLPEGQYVVVGLEVIGQLTVAARLVFPGQAMRPGAPAIGQPSWRTHDAFYSDAFGVYGRFPAFTPPNIEVLTDGNITYSASVPLQVYLRLIRVG